MVSPYCKVELHDLELSKNIENSKVIFYLTHRESTYYSYYGESYSCKGALKIFQALGRVNIALALEGRIRELAPEVDILSQERSTLSTCKEFNALREKILGPALADISFTLEEKKYKDDPLDNFLIEHTALKKGSSYITPKADEFLKQAAISLARFELPYQRDDFLITLNDIGHILRYLNLDDPANFHIMETIEKLRQYIIAEAKTDNVQLSSILHKELEAIGIKCQARCCGPDRVYLKLSINGKTDFLQIVSQYNPFSFINR